VYSEPEPILSRRTDSSGRLPNSGPVAKRERECDSGVARKRAIHFFRSFLLLVLVPSAVWAQGNVATLNGTVLDTSGAVVPGATVVATNVATGVETRTTTTSAGAYTLPYLPAGTYTLRVSAPGFRTATQENVILRVGQTQTLNITLGGRRGHRRGEGQRRAAAARVRFG
jgi:hypothetical protein